MWWNCAQHFWLEIRHRKTNGFYTHCTTAAETCSWPIWGKDALLKFYMNTPIDCRFYMTWHRCFVNCKNGVNLLRNFFTTYLCMQKSSLVSLYASFMIQNQLRKHCFFSSPVAYFAQMELVGFRLWQLAFLQVHFYSGDLKVIMQCNTEIFKLVSYKITCALVPNMGFTFRRISVMQFLPFTNGSFGSTVTEEYSMAHVNLLQVELCRPRRNGRMTSCKFLRLYRWPARQ